MTGMDDKEKLTEYGYAPEIFKQFIEDIFGEGYQISVYDGEAGKGKILFSGDLNGIASYTAQLNEDSAALRLEFVYNLFEREFDCKDSELVSEIDEWVDDYLDDYPDNSDYDTFQSNDTMIECVITLEFEPLFSNAQVKLMPNVEKMHTEIKKIIENHEK
tara:strand:- start:70 stop:549 length:480 start_codon:yes stop_codon:yes gene_type:complete